MSLTGSIKLAATGTLTSTRDLGAASVTEALAQTITLANGTGANQGTQIWGDTRSLAASTGEDLDLSGSLANGLGTTVAFNRIVFLGIKAASTNGSTISVGGAASAQFATWVGDASDIIKIRPGGFLALAAPDATGYAVTATTADLLKVLNDDSAAAASYSILLIGSTA